MDNIKTRLANEFEQMSTAKKVVYGVLLLGVTVFAFLSLSGAVNLFPV